MKPRMFGGDLQELRARLSRQLRTGPIKVQIAMAKFGGYVYNPCEYLQSWRRVCQIARQPPIDVVKTLASTYILVPRSK